MTSDFYVLIIDDKDTVCTRVKDKIQGGPPPGQVDPVVPVTPRAVHISLKEIGQSASPEESRWTFDNEVFRKLHDACDRRPDLVIIDYIYVNSKVASMIKGRAKKGQFRRSLMDGRALTPVDLRHWIEDNSGFSESKRQQFVRTLFHARCPVYLHTYTPPRLEVAVGSVEDRVRKMRQVFPYSELMSIDMRSELFNTEEFDSESIESQLQMMNDDYYPFQVAVYFDQVVKKEILRKRLKESRHLALRRTALSVSGITAIGAGIGFGAAWIGSVLWGFVSTSAYLEAVVVGLALLVFLTIAGTILPFVFDKLMQRVMQDDDRSKR